MATDAFIPEDSYMTFAPTAINMFFRLKQYVGR